MYMWLTHMCVVVHERVADSYMYGVYECVDEFVQTTHSYACVVHERVRDFKVCGGVRIWGSLIHMWCV